jgi:hypothetical protein
MWLQEVVSSRRFIVGAVVAATFIVAAWLYALSSLQYKQAKAIAVNEQLVSSTGEVKFTVLVGFNITSVEGRSSRVSLYVFGERASGYLRVTSLNGERGPVVDSASFGDHVLHPP